MWSVHLYTRERKRRIYMMRVLGICVCVLDRPILCRFAIVKSSYVRWRRWDVQIKILDSVRERGLLRATKQSAFFVAKTFLFFFCFSHILPSLHLRLAATSVYAAPQNVYVPMCMYTSTYIYVRMRKIGCRACEFDEK